MNFTDSRTCLVDQEMSCAGFDSKEFGCHYNTCALPMEGDWDSCGFNSSGTESQNSSTDSSDRLYFSPPRYPSPIHDHGSSHHRHQRFQQQEEQQQQCQMSHPRQDSDSSEGIMFSGNDINGDLDHHRGLKQQQQQQQQHHQHEQQTEQQQQKPPPLPRCGGEEEVMFFHSAKGVWDSLAYITSLTDMCDVVFHVGKTRQPVYGIKSLLSVRSRVMYLKILQAQRSTLPAPSKTYWKRLRHSICDNDVSTDSRIHVDVKDYDVKVFSQLLGFLHSGRVAVDADTVLGLYCAAAEFEVADLRTACWDFVERCVQRNQGQSLLACGRPYLSRAHLDKLRQKFF